MGGSRFCRMLASLHGNLGLALLLHPGTCPSPTLLRLLGLVRVVSKSTCSQEMLLSLPKDGRGCG